MATVLEMVTALDTFIESASGLNITCIKGFPDFLQPRIKNTLPICALFYAGSSSEADIRQRIGASSKPLAMTLAIYATDEINLFLLVELLHTMRETRPIDLTADGDLIKVYIGDDERVPPTDEDVKEIRHLVTCPIVIIYE